MMASPGSVAMRMVAATEKMVPCAGTIHDGSTSHERACSIHQQIPSR